MNPLPFVLCLTALGVGLIGIGIVGLVKQHSLYVIGGMASALGLGIAGLVWVLFHRGFLGDTARQLAGYAPVPPEGWAAGPAFLVVALAVVVLSWQLADKILRR